MGGNLGMYLWLTKIAKRFGGPVIFLVAVLGLGALVGIGLEKVISAIVKAIRKWKKDNEAEPVYTVDRDAVGEDGISFAAGDRFRVLMSEGEYALVERIKDEEHSILPVSFITGISDFTQA